MAEAINADSKKTGAARAPLLLLGLLVLMGFIVYKDYLIFKHVFFFTGVGSDTVNYSYPFLYNEADYIARHGWPSWSFNFGLGQNIFPFFLRDPFDIILYIAGSKHIYHAMVFIEYLKVVLSGMVFFYYLRTLKYSDYTAITGSLFFSFCGFMIIGGCWYVFSFEAFNMALLLLAFEQLFIQRKWLLFPIAIALMALSQPFNLYIYGTFLACYLLFRHAQEGRFRAKDIGTTFLKIICLGVIGVFISAPFLLENIAQLLESPRGSGAYSYHDILSGAKFTFVDAKQLGTAVMRLFSNDILGRGNAYYGWFNFLEAPALYCGLPCILLMPQVFTMLDKRQKITFAVFLGIWLIPLFFPYLRYAFWLFAGNYYRAYAFFISIIMMYFSLYALEQVITKKQKVNRGVLIITVLILFALLNCPFFDEEELKLHGPRAVGRTTYYYVSALLLVYTAILLLMRAKTIQWAKYVFALAVVAELTYASRTTVNNMDAVPTSDLWLRKGYNDCTSDAIGYIKAADPGFYRVDKTYFSSPAWFRSLNDGMVQRYYGTSSYASFNQQFYILYLKLMGVIDSNHEDESRWAPGLLDHPVLESENRVKYIISKDPMAPMWRQWYDSATTICDVHIFRNKRVLPFGYTYDTYMEEGNFEKLSKPTKDFLSLRAAVITREDALKLQGFQTLAPGDTSSAIGLDSSEYKKLAEKLVEDTLQLTSFSETSISGKINTSRDKVLYLAIPYDKGWSLYADGAIQEKMLLNAGMTGVLIKKGEHKIELRYKLRFFNTGLFFSALGLALYAGLLFSAFKRR